MSDEPEDTRDLLRRADEFMRRERYSDAIELYLRAATIYAERGVPLRALALGKQIEKIVDQDARSLRRHLGAALRLMRDAYRALGMEDEALAAQERLGKLEPPS